MEVPYSNGSGGVNGSNGMTRAERFEDEKQRIIQSCFARTDDEGHLMESYITHIRIIEDAAYPSTPPPPNANPAAKKPRLIIVAVRRSGRVRMHKARENVNGTFSIGKTWMLDDLTSIRSYNGSIPANQEEEQHKIWAGGFGFVVSLGKPYYWQANTQKEKQFFVASLVKIYTKYTGGRTPELTGFDAKERGQLLGIASRAPPSQTQSPAGSAPAPGYGQSQNRAPLRSDPSHEPSLEPFHNSIQRQVSPGGPRSFTSQPQRVNLSSGRDDSPGGSIDSSRVTVPGPIPQAVPANLGRLAGSNRSQDSFARSDDSASLPSASRGGVSPLPGGPGRFDRSVTPTSLRAATPDSTFSREREREMTSDAPPVPAPLSILPERRRPPMPIVGDSRQRNQTSNDNIVPAPLASPGMQREELRPPVRNIERTQTRDRDSDAVSSGFAMKSLSVQEPEPTSDSLPSTNSGAEPVKSPIPAHENPPAEPIPPLVFTKAQAQQVEEDSRPGLGPMMKQQRPIAVTSPVSPMSPDSLGEVDESRPGLGPMIKKKKSKADVANSLLKLAKAANSYNAFKPRPGGAAEKLRQIEVEDNSPDGPDGITGVIPAPSLLRGMNIENKSNYTTPTSTSVENVMLRDLNSVPEVKITIPESKRPNSYDGASKSEVITLQSEEPKPKEVKRPKPPSEIMQKELASINVDPSILGGRGTELITAWEEFGWTGEGVHTKNIDQMKEEIERELNRARAGGWLTRLDEEDERIAAVHAGLDKCITECDELDGLLTLNLVELSTRNEDVAYIEAQSQGLQVQAANQKLLQAELNSLLETISISSEQLKPLHESSLETSHGLGQLEASLVRLFKAMLSIDPTLSSSVPRASEDGSLSSGRQAGFSTELGSMRVMQEKKEVYRSESAQFLRRLRPFLQVKFAAAIDETRKALEREKGGNLTRSGKAKLDTRNHDLAREVLWKYSPLMLFSREANRPEWEELLKIYESVAKPLYQDEFRDAIFAWKRNARKPTGDEGDVLFTSQVEKQAEGIATTARKLTVKRSQTLAKSLRSPIGDNSSKTSVDRGTDGKFQPHEIFSNVIDEIVPVVTMEQNFIVDFFHVTSLEQLDFPEAVAAATPETRRGTDLKRPKVMDPDRDLAKQVVISMDEVYSFLQNDMMSLVDWSLQSDPLQGVGLIAAIERKLLHFEESSQEFLARTFQKIHAKLVGLFTKFLDDQIRAIEETKVKIKKRKGVIGFVKIFPSFSSSLETMLGSADNLEIRETVNNAYNRINKAMFESLKVIARENPSAQTTGADPEDKEALNYQILLIENMNHYLEEVDSRSNPALEDWKQNATQEMDEHMSLYVGAVVRRPLGKLLDFLESIESLMLSQQPGEPASQISGMPSHSSTTFKKVLAGYDSREVRKGIETLKKRVEKHFGDADEPGTNRSLVAKVQENCQKYYEKVDDRILTISRDVYDGDIIADFANTEIVAAFRK
ncbi:exocyst complex component Sec3-domain-containing protein [Calycina marina]|uniref:Exocyst complex component Sec3-domain-containing protein n=1 Tax=Calycina marina TaxID=1763456 RepID=A0A9P8CHH1_9HELO|nr:exocyst complex component Sec3-domain-containing protein [Calycina marina]